MQTITIFYIVLAIIAALLATLFLYKYKSKSALKTNALFVVLRFLSVFLILLLLINPQIETKSFYNEKPNLILLSDNSNSIKLLNQEEVLKNTTNKLLNNADLNKKFNVVNYTFNTSLSKDSLSFNYKETNISKAILELNSIYKNSISPTIILTDGNQTIGSDYVFSAKSYNQNLYPIVVGDTTIYNDIKISTLNVNKYAYLKNKFPVEVIINYNGKEPVEKEFIVQKNNKVVFSKQLNLTSENNAQVLQFNLEALKVGLQNYTAKISTLEKEKNTTNNTKNFAIEVIDETTNIAIVSTLAHPDLGVLKKSIASNKQRKVSIIKPSEVLQKYNDFQLLILYQPNREFKAVYDLINKENSNTFTITGTKTDWNFINQNANFIKLEASNQTENYQANLNSGFNAFIIPDLDFNSFPPLKSTFGSIQIKQEHQTLLYKAVNEIVTDEPLLFTIENNEKRHAYLLGEDLWKWRQQSFLNQQSFEEFDDFTGKLVQYLASKKRKDRLSLEYNRFYDGTTNPVFKAQIFNKNYEFDDKESLSISLTEKTTLKKIALPMVLKNNYYEVDLGDLKPSDYSFTVKTKESNLLSSGSFKILNYNVEAQFSSANIKNLKNIAYNSDGQWATISDYTKIVTQLLNDKRYLPIQKNKTVTNPLIDWYYLLFLIILVLSIEWFLRKFKGLI